MCLILFSYDIHTQYRLVFAANRDEYYRRPTRSLGTWAEAPEMIAGRDLQAGGTWLGVSRNGKFAAITNFRDPSEKLADPLSRGSLVAAFLRDGQSAAAYVRNLDTSEARRRYNGFNLLAGDASGLWYFSNRGPAPRRLSPGLYGLSNHLLDTPWPKVETGKARLQKLLQHPGDLDPEALFAMLTDRTRPPDSQLPHTGVELAWERTLSPMFIASPEYGTRSSSLLIVRRNGQVAFLERSYDEDRTRRFDVTIPPEAALPPPGQDRQA